MDTDHFVKIFMYNISKSNYVLLKPCNLGSMVWSGHRNFAFIETELKEVGTSHCPPFLHYSLHVSRNIFIGAVTRVAVFVVVLADEMMLSKTLAVHLNCWDLDASPPHSPRYKKSSLEQKQLKRRATRSSGWPEKQEEDEGGKVLSFNLERVLRFAAHCIESA